MLILTKGRSVPKRSKNSSVCALLLKSQAMITSLPMFVRTSNYFF